ncbi:MAG: DUF2231 domain-containing protein [Sphingobacteriales bacterium]|nr:MAG: DUF2231 domain-containing protein [Sphingobacteriales bacterium]
MKSKASFRSHPVHPILVTFPIAFFTGAFIADLYIWYTGEASFVRFGSLLIGGGIAGGILAAIAGITDFMATVPPDSSASKRAAKHGLLNTIVLLIFAFNLYTRNETGNLLLQLLLSSAGIIILLFAGYMGGTLVYRNQIGVDIRYADSGKWREIQAETVDGRIPAGDEKDLKEGQMLLVKTGKERIVVARSQNEILAFSDYCPHKGGSLAGGCLMAGKVQCPWHGSQFDIRSGKAEAGPAEKGIPTYPVRIIEGKIWITRP